MRHNMGRGPDAFAGFLQDMQDRGGWTAPRRLFGCAGRQPIQHLAEAERDVDRCEDGLVSILERASHPLADTRQRTALAGLLVFAFLLRIWGLTYGLPFVEEFTSDAEMFVPLAVHVTLRNPSPHWFGLPGSTVIYPLALVFHLENWLARELGATDLYVEQAFAQNATPFYATGRLLAASAGTLAVLVVYLIGREISCTRAGLVAVGLLALSPLDIFVSHLARPDTLVVLLTSLSLLFCMKILKEPGWEYYAAAGASAGLAMSSKYYGGACNPLSGGRARVRGQGAAARGPLASRKRGRLQTNHGACMRSAGFCCDQPVFRAGIRKGLGRPARSGKDHAFER